VLDKWCLSGLRVRQGASGHCRFWSFIADWCDGQRDKKPGHRFGYFYFVRLPLNCCDGTGDWAPYSTHNRSRTEGRQTLDELATDSGFQEPLRPAAAMTSPCPGHTRRDLKNDLPVVDHGRPARRHAAPSLRVTCPSTARNRQRKAGITSPSCCLQTPEGRKMTRPQHLQGSGTVLRFGGSCPSTRNCLSLQHHRPRCFAPAFSHRPGAPGPPVWRPDFGFGGPQLDTPCSWACCWRFVVTPCLDRRDGGAAPREN